MGVSKTMDTPKWMVYNGKPYSKWMIWGENPLFSETPLSRIINPTVSSENIAPRLLADLETPSLPRHFLDVLELGETLGPFFYD